MRNEFNKQGNKVNNREYGVCVPDGSGAAQFDGGVIKIANIRHLTLTKDVLVSVTCTFICLYVRQIFLFSARWRY